MRCEPDQPDPRRPNLITNVATTASTVPDVKMTTPIHRELARRHLLPAEHYVDSGYPSAEVIEQAHRQFGLTLVTPALLDTSRQARAGDGFDKTAFTIDWQTRQVSCPQGQSSATWSPARQRGTEVIVVKFDTATCRACPVRDQCTTAARGGRQLTLRPQQLHQALARARAEQTTQTWKSKYAIRAGAESHHPPGGHHRRDAPSPLPRPAQGGPTARVRRDRDQPHPPARVVDPPTSAVCPQSQPPHPPQSRSRCLIRNRIGQQSQPATTNATTHSAEPSTSPRSGSGSATPSHDPRDRL